MIIRAGRIALPRLCHTSCPPRLYHTSSPQFTAIDRTVPLNDPHHPVALDYAFYQHNQKYTDRVGSTLAPHYKPHQLLTRPPSPRDITLEALIAAQSHIGHATSLWNPSNARYIFGVRGQHDPIHIISPDATASHLRRACRIVEGVAERGGLILFVGTRQGQARAVVKAAELAHACHLFTKWIPGSITNGQQILGRCEKRVKNEVDEDVTEQYGFEDQLYAKAAIKPDLVVCLNPLENYVLLHECGSNNIPTVGIIDTDANPTWVTYPIPANDDSLRAVHFICGVLGRAGQQGQERRLRDAAPRRGWPNGHVVYPPMHGLHAPEEERLGRRGGDGGSAKHMKIRPRGAEEPLFPDDFQGADVTNHEKDQALLAQAERTLFNENMEAAAAANDLESEEVIQPERDQALLQAAQTALSEESAELTIEDDLDSEGLDVYASFNESSEPDLSDVDPSLVDDAYAPSELPDTSAEHVKDVDPESQKEVDAAVEEAKEEK